MDSRTSALLADAVIERLPIFWAWGPGSRPADLFTEGTLAGAPGGPCPCGCRLPVPVVLGRGRPAKWASAACGRRMSRRAAA